MVRAGMSLPALQHLMGHAQIGTTMLYVQLAPQDVWREYARALAWVPVPGELLFRVTAGHVTLFVLNARLMRPYVHPLNVADFKGNRAG